MANSKEARLILGRELWDELGDSLLRVSVEGKPCAMRIRNFWTSCMYTELMIRSPEGTQKWLPELAGPGRSPALVDFLEFCKDFSGEFEVVKSSDLSPAEFDLISEQQSRLQEAAQAAKELDEQKQAARKGKNKRKRNKGKGKNTPPQDSGEGAGDLNAGSDEEASKKEETRVKGAEAEVQLEAASDSLQQTGIQDEEASKENQVEASEVLQAETEENQEEEANKENPDEGNQEEEASKENPEEEASKVLQEEETVYLSLKGKRVPVNETTLYKLLSGRDDVLKAVQSLQKAVQSLQGSVQRDLKEVRKDLKDMHFDISMVCEASGRAIVKAFAEDKYGMQTAVPLPHSLTYPVDDEVEALARLCPSPVGESPREVPTNADIDCYLAFKADLQGQYVHPPENLEKPTPSSKLLYKLVQLERAIAAVEATSGVGSVKAVVLASPAFRHVSPENGVLLLKSVLDECGGKLKKLERLAAHDLHTLAL